jgi:hypothetical protein
VRVVCIKRVIADLPAAGSGGDFKTAFGEKISWQGTPLASLGMYDCNLWTYGEKDNIRN